MLFTLHMSSVNPLDIANNMYLLKREVKERKILFHTEGTACAKILELQVGTITCNKRETEEKPQKPDEVGVGEGRAWLMVLSQLTSRLVENMVFANLTLLI